MFLLINFNLKVIFNIKQYNSHLKFKTIKKNKYSNN